MLEATETGPLKRDFVYKSASIAREDRSLIGLERPENRTDVQSRLETVMGLSATGSYRGFLLGRVEVFSPKWMPPAGLFAKYTIGKLTLIAF